MICCIFKYRVLRPTKISNAHEVKINDNRPSGPLLCFPDLSSLSTDHQRDITLRSQRIQEQPTPPMRHRSQLQQVCKLCHDLERRKQYKFFSLHCKAVCHVLKVVDFGWYQGVLACQWFCLKTAIRYKSRNWQTPCVHNPLKIAQYSVDLWSSSMHFCPF